MQLDNKAAGLPCSRFPANQASPALLAKSPLQPEDAQPNSALVAAVVFTAFVIVL